MIMYPASIGPDHCSVIVCQIKGTEIDDDLVLIMRRHDYSIVMVGGYWTQTQLNDADVQVRKAVERQLI